MQGKADNASQSYESQCAEKYEGFRMLRKAAECQGRLLNAKEGCRSQGNYKVQGKVAECQERLQNVREDCRMSGKVSECQVRLQNVREGCRMPVKAREC